MLILSIMAVPILLPGQGTLPLPEEHGITERSPKDDTPSEPARMIQAIQRRQETLEQRAHALEEKEARLRAYEREIQGLFDRYKKLQEEVDRKVDQARSQRDQEKERRFRRLAKMYETMPAEDAAPRIEQMKMPLALNVLARIKEKKSALILTNMSPQKAAHFTEALSRFPYQPDSK